MFHGLPRGKNHLRIPRDVKAIAKAKVKTDERDSYKLAHLLRTLQAVAGESFISAGVASEGLLRGEADSGEEPAAGASGAAGRRDTRRGCSSRRRG